MLRDVVADSFAWCARLSVRGSYIRESRITYPRRILERYIGSASQYNAFCDLRHICGDTAIDTEGPHPQVRPFDVAVLGFQKGSILGLHAENGFHLVLNGRAHCSTATKERDVFDVGFVGVERVICRRRKRAWWGE